MARQLPAILRNSWVRKFLFLFLLVVAIDYFFLHILLPQKKSALLQAYNQEVNESLKRNPPPENANDLTVPKMVGESELNQEFPTEFKKCFTNWSGASPSNVKELLTGLDSRIGLNKISRDIENIHWKIANGEQRRLQIVSSEHADHPKVMKLFKLDPEGVPEPMPKENADLGEPTPQNIKALIGAASVHFHEVKEARTYKDGSRVYVQWLNETPKEFQFLNAQHTLSCHLEKCRCL